MDPVNALPFMIHRKGFSVSTKQTGHHAQLIIENQHVVLIDRYHRPALPTAAGCNNSFTTNQT
jgi:hypothetical protein